jgi:hypothetical protein
MRINNILNPWYVDSLANGFSRCGLGQLVVFRFSIIGIQAKLAVGTTKECPDLGRDLFEFWGCAVYLIYGFINSSHKTLYSPTSA